MTHEDIARTAHEVNKGYCLALGDHSQPSWDDAPQWQKDSCIEGVENQLSVGETPEESHKSWMDHKILNGWKYGPKKIPELKEHPCILSYHDLPKEQQAKDFIFRAVVHSLREYHEELEPVPPQQ